jgi:hypothetical protein
VTAHLVTSEIALAEAEAGAVVDDTEVAAAAAAAADMAVVSTAALSFLHCIFLCFQAVETCAGNFFGTMSSA